MRYTSLFFVLLLCLNKSIAAPKKPTLPNRKTAQQEDLVIIDELVKKLKQDKRNKSALAIKQLWTELETKNKIISSKKINEIKTDSLFTEYIPVLTGENYLRQSLTELKKKNWKASENLARNALDEFLKIISDYPTSYLKREINEKLATIDLILANSFYHQKNYLKSQNHFEMTFLRSSFFRIPTIYEISSLENYPKICIKNDQTQLCQKWMTKLLGSYPKGSLENVRFNEILSATKNTFMVQENVSPYEKFVTTYKALDLDQQLFDQAIKNYFEKQYADAKTLFEQLRTQFPKSSLFFRATFLLAKILKDYEDEPEEAEKLFLEIFKNSPLSYYGIMSSFFLKKNLFHEIENAIPKAKTGESFLDPIDRKRLTRAEKFFSVGLFPLVKEELKSIVIKANYSNEFLIYLASLNHFSENDLGAFQVLTELVQRRAPVLLNRYIINLNFPIRFFETIKKHANFLNTDPILILSLIKKESGFETSTISRSGALGLTQVMPFTAIEVDSKVFQTDLIDIDKNISLGASYLQKLISKFNGNIVFALAGYNAGPHRVDQWKKEFKSDLDMINFIEYIPYKETQDYVVSILRNYFWYKYLIDKEEMISFERFWKSQDQTK